LAHTSRTPEKGTGALTTAAGARQARAQGRRPPPDRRQADRPHPHAAGAGYKKPGLPLTPNRLRLVAISHTFDYGWISRGLRLSPPSGKDSHQALRSLICHTGHARRKG